MSKCPYWIKDARKDMRVFHHCKLDDGHKCDHQPWPPRVGETDYFEGKWHREGEPWQAEQVPLITAVPFVQKISTSEASNINSNNRKENQ